MNPIAMKKGFILNKYRKRKSFMTFNQLFLLVVPKIFCIKSISSFYDVTNSSVYIIHNDDISYIFIRRFQQNISSVN